VVQAAIAAATVAVTAGAALPGAPGNPAFQLK